MEPFLKRSLPPPSIFTHLMSCAVVFNANVVLSRTRVPLTVRLPFKVTVSSVMVSSVVTVQSPTFTIPDVSGPVIMLCSLAIGRPSIRTIDIVDARKNAARTGTSKVYRGWLMVTGLEGCLINLLNDRMDGTTLRVYERGQALTRP